MNFLSLLSFAVFASEVVLSPLADDVVFPAATTTLIPTPTEKYISLTEIADKAVALPTPTPTFLVTPTPTATPMPTPRLTQKRAYTISLLGDSMIDTLGLDGGGLAAKLNETYPTVQFTVFNNGLGATNIDSGVERLTDSYNYSGIVKSSVISENPDIVVIESFGYNPYTYTEGAIDAHWLQLAHIVDILKSRLPATKIIIAATIAPNSERFGDGAPFIKFTSDEKWRRAETIKQYIQNAIRFAQSQKLPLADAFTESMDAAGEGKLEFINAKDHIHYSPAGRSLMAGKISEAIVGSRMLE